MNNYCPGLNLDRDVLGCGVQQPGKLENAGENSLVQRQSVDRAGI